MRWLGVGRQQGYHTANRVAFCIAQWENNRSPPRPSSETRVETGPARRGRWWVGRRGRRGRVSRRGPRGRVSRRWPRGRVGWPRKRVGWRGRRGRPGCCGRSCSAWRVAWARAGVGRRGGRKRSVQLSVCGLRWLAPGRRRSRQRGALREHGGRRQRGGGRRGGRVGGGRAGRAKGRGRHARWVAGAQGGAAAKGTTRLGLPADHEEQLASGPALGAGQVHA